MLKYKKNEAKAWAKEHLTGDITTYPTIFRENGEVDLEAMRSNFQRSLKFGAEGFWVNGVVGEHFALTKEEKRKILELAVEEGAKNKVPVISAVTYGGIKDAMEMLKHAEDVGTDCVFLGGPTGETLSEESVYEWYKYIAERVNISLFIFNTSTYHPLLPKYIAKLAAECPNIVGLKPLIPAFAGEVMRAFREAHTELLLYTPLSIRFLTVLSGIVPAELATSAGAYQHLLQNSEDQVATKCWQLAKQGELAKSGELYFSTVGPRADFLQAKLYNWVTIFQPTHNIPLWKYWYELMGFHGGPTRMPYLPATLEAKRSLKEGLVRLGIIKG